MKQLKVYILVVIYNKSCKEMLPFFDCVIKAENSPMVFDNSTQELDNRSFCEEKGIVYLGGRGNLGLSRAYNEAIDYCTTQGEDGVICFFDDDTVITKDYLDAVKQGNTGESGVFVPLLKSGTKLISPAILKENYHCTFFDKKEDVFGYQGHNLTALNSGMAVTLTVFADYRYDERLFLDGIDHKFMMDMAKRAVPVHILDCTLVHHLSALEKPSIESALSRYEIFKKDVKVFAGDAYKSILWRRTLKLTLQYKTFAFLKASHME
ncbi:MAG TPA: glycosyltransferase [Clostridiales bacterium]|nr:glycosyltransferase [Clostridiales bacterium]